MDSDSYSAIGQLLRTARVDKRLNLWEASRPLHIRVKYLEALEEGRLEDIPGLTYTKGYLQSYAQFLDLDKDEILRRFEQLEGLLVKKTIYFPQALSREKLPAVSYIWGGLALALAIYVLWLLAGQAPQAILSIVEDFRPEAAEKMTISAAFARNVPCLNPQERLYPPCTAGREGRFYLLPLPVKVESVLELEK